MYFLNKLLSPLPLSSGTKVIMNDAEGSIFIEDPSGNTWHMDGQGDISVDAPQNININAGANISISAGQNIITSAGINLTETAGGMIAQSAALDYTLMAANIMEMATGKRSAQADEVVEHGKHKAT